MRTCAHLRPPIPCHINRADPKEPLGCKLRGNLVIAILPGGLAFKSNLQLDHYILSVNGVPTTGMVAADIVELIDKQGLHMVLQTMPMVSIDQSLLQFVSSSGFVVFVFVFSIFFNGCFAAFLCRSFFFIWAGWV